MHVAEAKNERYTPLWMRPMVLDMFEGSIDTDPAAEPSNRMRATVFYTQDQDGLNQDWFGNVWLNPPYNPSGVLIKWTLELLRRFEQDKSPILNALYLIPAKTETAYFKLLERYPVLFFDRRLQFDMPSEQGKPQQGAMFPSALFYLGPNVQRFAEIFGEHGRVYGAKGVWW